ncbi:MAG: hypothetical protein ACYTFZ_09610 [Planctomycetota bacterium]
MALLSDDAQGFLRTALAEGGLIARTNPKFFVNAIAARMRLNYPLEVADWPTGQLENLIAHEFMHLIYGHRGAADGR